MTDQTKPASQNEAEENKAKAKAAQPKGSDLSVNRKGFIEALGEITELLPGRKFRVDLETGQEIIATMKGRMAMHRIQLVTGDKVKVEMSPYDLTKGRIVYRQ